MTIIPTPDINAGIDLTICEGEVFDFSPTVNSDVWDYDSLVDSPSIGFITYTVSGTNGNLCSATDELVLEIVACAGLEIMSIEEDDSYEVYDLNGKILKPNSLPLNQLLLKVYKSGKVEKLIVN